MAVNPEVKLAFGQGCPDCGRRNVILPSALPDPGDDFDWQLRDYDGFRLFMMQELAARFPERSRWTPADLELVIVELLSTVLDQLSDTLDRISAEAFLETARQPASVRRLLGLLGYDAVSMAAGQAHLPDATADAGEDEAAQRQRICGFLPALQSYLDDYQGIVEALSADEQDALAACIIDPQSADADALAAVQLFLEKAPEFVRRASADALECYWASHPGNMNLHRQAGPRSVHEQRRMVTLNDYANRLEEHPLVHRAAAWSEWSGSWNSVQVAVIARDNSKLEQPIPADSDLRSMVNTFHREHGLPEVHWAVSPSFRTGLRLYVDAWRMAGQEVLLQDARPVGISMSISVRVADHYFQSEVRYAVEQSLGTGPAGFFEPGRLCFGEDLHASDIFEVLMALDGVDAVCLNRFKRVGKQYSDQSDSGLIELDGLEIAVCDNQAEQQARGYYSLYLHGGRKG